MPSKERKGKWQPYDALEGYKATLRQVDYEKGKVEKPILMPDALEELNEQLNEAINNHKDIKVSYYKNGYIYDIEGVITRIDPINKEIIIGLNKIKVNTIYSISDIN